MKPDTHHLIRAVALLGWLSFCDSAFSSSQCESDGIQASGSVYRICMPDANDYNGRLIIWAHGFQNASDSVGIPEDQLEANGQSIQGLVNDLGFGFATNSYSKTGLAVRQGMADILDLVKIYSAAKGAPNKIYLVGASEGGLITTLLVEKHPEIFDGGIAACGPIGDFSYQLRYIGDSRATFDYFFPSLIPGDPFRPTPDLIATWAGFYPSTVKPFITAQEQKKALNQWARVAKVPYNSRQPQLSRENAAYDLLRYAVLNLNEAGDTLGGFPFGNAQRHYTGLMNNRNLNLLVPRVSVDAAAITEIQDQYTTSGRLESPLITLHSTGDWLVPYQHESLYMHKTKDSDSYLKQHLNIQTSSYGHCQFTQGEVLFAVSMLGVYTQDSAIADGLTDQIKIPSLKKEFRKLADRNKIRINFSGIRIRIKLPGGIHL